ncbi:MAG: hypothetical protein J5I50_09180 [Chitinophagaceae bacterium]|nr:hypothetical protein [Chitinophagaceae bacterium]
MKPHEIVKNVWFILFLFLNFQAFAQYEAPFYLKFTEADMRSLVEQRLIKNVINKALATPLTEENEDSWEAAFNAMEVVGYSSPFTWQKVQEAMTAMSFHSLSFQRSALEAVYALYPKDFMSEVSHLMKNTTDTKIFGMCAVYLLKSDRNTSGMIEDALRKNFSDSLRNHPILRGLTRFMNEDPGIKAQTEQALKTLISKSFLPGETVVYSFQRKNRDYPGLVMVRKKDGSFVRDNGEYFHAPQLARGIANLPYFLTKGNTPQGLYRMFGFGVSSNQSIGPTANIQLGMPVELSKAKFFDNKEDNSEWSIEDYRKVLPDAVKNFTPLFETYIAGSAGRNEIIAHGTTIDPAYYVGKPYYPMTPTEGCLSTKEFWDGKLIYSDQQRLVNALLAAGGAYGYLLVLELNDEDRPVTLKDVLPLMP